MPPVPPFLTPPRPALTGLVRQGDYWRYLAEVHTEGQREKDSAECQAAYSEGLIAAKDKLASTHSLRLGIALNYSGDTLPPPGAPRPPPDCFLCCTIHSGRHVICHFRGGLVAPVVGAASKYL